MRLPFTLLIDKLPGRSTASSTSSKDFDHLELPLLAYLEICTISQPSLLKLVCVCRHVQHEQAAIQACQNKWQEFCPFVSYQMLLKALYSAPGRRISHLGTFISSKECRQNQGDADFECQMQYGGASLQVRGFGLGDSELQISKVVLQSLSGFSRSAYAHRWSSPRG